MALNYIFVGFFLISFVVALCRFFFMGDTEVFGNIVESTFDMAKISVTICIGLIGVMTFWLGIMRVGEKGGAIKIFTKMVSPLFSRLFPEIPKEHPAMGSMMMNFSANMLGLDNAATPLGLKAMKQLQEINPSKTKASNAQIMFLVLNTSGLTIVPVSVMAVMAARIAASDVPIEMSPTGVFIPILIATFFSTLVGLVGVGIRQGIRLWDPIVLAYLGGLTAVIVSMLFWFSHMEPDRLAKIASFGGNFIIFGFIIFFLALAFFRKVNVFEEFIKGAKEGFKVSIKIIPYLVAMLVAIGVFRASGSLDLILDGLKFILGEANAAVDSMPVAFMKPLSGSGARAAMIEVWEANTIKGVIDGMDTFQGKLAAVMQGSTETTFYTLAVYFGAVRITNTRYTVWFGLLADLAGIAAAIVTAYMFFG